MITEQQILARIVDILRTKANVIDDENFYSSPDVTLRARQSTRQLTLSYDTITEQWAILLKIDGSYFAIGGYKSYRLFENHDFETFIDLETGQPVSSDMLTYIFEELQAFDDID